MSVIRAEWMKFRTVRGWVLAMLAAAAAIAGVAVLPGMRGTCTGDRCAQPTGPGGEAVTDSFYFVHQPLPGDGSVTVRVAALTGSAPTPAGQMKDLLLPWAKAGIIVKASLNQGSAYAAIMVTGGHGVRMQYDYTGDIAGPSDTAVRWLRLRRHGASITGYASADGARWQVVGTVVLPGFGGTVQAGPFVTSPQYAVTSMGVSAISGSGTQARGVFDHLTLSGGRSSGGWSSGGWSGTDVGSRGHQMPLFTPGYQAADGTVTVTGSGDIAPAVAGADGVGVTIAQTLAGVFIALILAVTVGAMMMTAEYRSGLVRLTLAATPRRWEALAGKAGVAGAVAFFAGLAGAAVAVPIGQRVLRANGTYVAPVSLLSELRVIAGTALVLALAAVMAVAIGAIVRRGTTAVATVAGLVVVPYLLAVTAPLLPLTAIDWLTRVTPAAAFAVQQTAVRYPQVDNVYAPSYGYYPLPPWAGMLVLCAWAAAALGLALILFARRDA